MKIKSFDICVALGYVFVQALGAYLAVTFIKSKDYYFAIFPISLMMLAALFLCHIIKRRTTAIIERRKKAARHEP